MEKPAAAKMKACCLASILLLLSFYIHFLGTSTLRPFSVSPNSSNPSLNPFVAWNSSQNDFLSPTSTSQEDSCRGRYIYVHDLPPRFNAVLLLPCRMLTRVTDGNMCQYLQNAGLGPLVDDPEGLLSNGSWYKTNQFLLEVIFHEKMKRYDCLTQDSSFASAVYMPYYTGLDISQYLYSNKISVRDAAGFDLMRWLSGRPEWGRMFGRDHFFVAGRIAWDFRRQLDIPTDWG
ncbi:hypothetical protein MLD38_010991 [Melastoma candidum]|uniref:Uncharacterized protein n=1 Tax=Melastoma candidum TaxID=119954 RepID=A0ACB9R1P6_9MYRT|nr:hypothetical protein MLD38_010991 [Melastoma candidum]